MTKTSLANQRWMCSGFLLFFLLTAAGAQVQPTSSSNQLTPQGVSANHSQNLYGVYQYSISWSPQSQWTNQCLPAACPTGLTPSVVCESTYQDSSVPGADNVGVSCPVANVTVFYNNPPVPTSACSYTDLTSPNKTTANYTDVYIVRLSVFTTYIQNAQPKCYIGGYTDIKQYPTLPTTHVACYLYCNY